MKYAKINLKNECEGILYGVNKEYAISKGCTLYCPNETNIGDIYKNGKWYKQNTEEEISPNEIMYSKIQLQNENKKALNEFLSDETITWTDGEQYGVTEQDQNEMGLNLIQYQVVAQSGLPATLEWHSKGKKCKSFTEKEFKDLALKIIQYVYPYRRKQEEIKEQIYNATNYEELFNIDINYE